MSSVRTFDSDGRYLGMTAEEWHRHDKMTDADIEAAALLDPDNPPLTLDELDRMNAPAFARTLRSSLRMTRTVFAETYGIPLATLEAWERHQQHPSPVEEAYLKLIAREPNAARVSPAVQTAAE